MLYAKDGLPTLMMLQFIFLLVFISCRMPKTASWTSPTSSLTTARPPPQVLRELLHSEMNGTRSTDDGALASSSPILLPCCYDGLTARLVARAGFQATFMTGFGVSAVHGFPDTQLISYQEMQATCLAVAEGLASVALEKGGNPRRPPIPCIADGDTGYGNAINVQRTVWGYARAGMAGIMIEDQVSPKRCGHVTGKAVVSEAEALQRVKAAVDARDAIEELYGPGTGPLILARTDALRTDGLEAAIYRCQSFVDAGADMTFLEAPESIEDMKAYCDQVPGPKLANMLEQGSTPILPPSELKEIGYTMAAYPLTLLSASIKAMQDSLTAIREGKSTENLILPFTETKDAVGFTRYARLEQEYRTD